MEWLTPLWNTVRKGFRHERTFADPWAIARAILAVAAASVIGVLLDDLVALTMMSVGAFICSIGTLLAPVRHRAVAALTTALCFGAAVTAGVFLHEAGWWFIPVLAVVAFAAGLWRTFGVAPGIRACLVVIGMMVTADVAPNVANGLVMTRWICVGAALSVLVQLLPPYGQRNPAQRKNLAAVVRALAEAARNGGPVPAAPFTAARNALDLLPQFARPAAAPLFGLLGEAEGIRRALGHLPADAPRAAIAGVLDAVAAAVTAGRPARAGEEDRRAVALWTGAAAESLVPRLREAEDLALAAATRRGGDAFAPHREIPGLYRGGSIAAKGWRRLRSELRPGAPMFMHAVRIGIGTAAAEAAGRWIGDFWGNGLPQHGFWAALTTMLVIFPDFEHTFARGWARPVGSIAGGFLAWGLLLVTPWSSLWIGVVAVVFAALILISLRTGQALLNVFITAWIVFLIHHLGTPDGPIAYGRPADTVLGALIGFAVFLLLPTWHHRRVPGVLARWIRLQDRVLPDLVTGFTAAGALDRAAFDELRTRSRELREQLDEAVARTAAEPFRRRAPWDAAGLRRLQERVTDLARCESLLVELLPRTDAEAAPELADFAGALHAELSALARAAAGADRVPAGGLRAAFDALATRTGLAQLADPASPDGVSHAHARVLAPWLHTVAAVEALAGAVDARFAAAPAAAGAGAGSGGARSLPSQA